MTLEQLGNLGELIGSIGVILSLVYLGRQIQQQNTITRAQFGHSLTQRLYDRYFQTSEDEDYARFMAKFVCCDLKMKFHHHSKARCLIETKRPPA